MPAGSGASGCACGGVGTGRDSSRRRGDQAVAGPDGVRAAAPGPGAGAVCAYRARRAGSPGRRRGRLRPGRAGDGGAPGGADGGGPGRRRRGALRPAQPGDAPPAAAGHRGRGGGGAAGVVAVGGRAASGPGDLAVGVRPGERPLRAVRRRRVGVPAYAASFLRSAHARPAAAADGRRARRGPGTDLHERAGETAAGGQPAAPAAAAARARPGVDCLYLPWRAG